MLQVHLWFTASLAGIHTNDCQMICAWSQSNHSITLPVSAFWLFNYQLNAFKKAQTYGTLYELASLSKAKRNWCYIWQGEKSEKSIWQLLLKDKVLTTQPQKDTWLTPYNSMFTKKIRIHTVKFFFDIPTTLNFLHSFQTKISLTCFVCGWFSLMRWNSSKQTNFVDFFNSFVKSYKQIHTQAILNRIW